LTDFTEELIPEVNAEQPPKALNPIHVTDDGIVTEVKAAQPSKA